MRLLFDTHAFLWWINRRIGQVSGTAHQAIADSSDLVLVSSVSAFEIATKHAIGKLADVEQLLANFEQRLEQERFTPLAVEIRHAVAVAQLPLLHRDPFDRLLIAQALTDGLTLVSNEALFDRYGVRRLW